MSDASFQSHSTSQGRLLLYRGMLPPLQITYQQIIRPPEQFAVYQVYPWLKEQCESKVSFPSTQHKDSIRAENRTSVPKILSLQDKYTTCRSY